MAYKQFFKVGGTIINCDLVTHVEHLDKSDERWVTDVVEKDPETTYVFFGPGQEDCIIFIEEDAATAWKYFNENVKAWEELASWQNQPSPQEGE